MKHLVLISLAVFGALSLAFWGIRAVGRMIAPGYEVDAARQFGSAAVIHEIETLYTRVENSKLGAEMRPVKAEFVGFASVRRVPKSWLPTSLSGIWGGVLDSDSIEWGDVLAYYDESSRLVGIEFYGSRYGCFISRDATRCPPWFRSLHRLADKPLFITTRITGDD
jgi:hypothetical protein